MTGEPTLHEIPYFEYKTINDRSYAVECESCLKQRLIYVQNRFNCVTPK